MSRFLTLFEGARPDSCGWDRCEDDVAYGVEVADHPGHGLMCRRHMLDSIRAGVQIVRMWTWNRGVENPKGGDRDA